MNGTLTAIASTPRTVTFRFTPELGAKAEIFVVGCAAQDAEEP